MVKVTCYLVIAGQCNIAQDSNTCTDTKLLDSVVSSAIINDESRFVDTVNGTRLYATSYNQTDDECWVIAVGTPLSHEEVVVACLPQQHIIWKPRSIMERIEDWFDRDERDPMLIKGNKSVI